MQMANTFHAQTPIGQSLQNISQAMFASAGTPLTAVDYSKMDLNNARIAKIQAELDAANREREGQTELGNLFAGLETTYGEAPRLDPDMVGPMPGQWNAPDYAGSANDIASLVAQYGLDTQDTADLYRFALANGGAPDDYVARSFVGAGDAIGVNDAFSLPGQEGIALRNSALAMQEDINKINNTPLTQAQVLGGLLKGEIPGLGEREISTLIGTLDTPDMKLIEGPDGSLTSLDVNDPSATLGAVPGVGAGGVLDQVYGAQPFGGNDNDATTTQKNLEAEADVLGITLQELSVKKTVEDYIRSNGIAGRAGLPEAQLIQYDRIMDKINANAGASAAVLPDGFTLIDP